MPTTANLGIVEPTVGADDDAWGTKLNTALSLLDGLFSADGTGTSVGLNVGAGKTLSIAGQLNVSGSPLFTGATFTISSIQPDIRFEESDQTDPAGRFRISVNADSFKLQRSTGAGWTSANSVFSVTGSTQVLDFTQVPTIGGSAILKANNNLAELTSPTTARSNLGLGTMATQASGSVAITGGTIGGITDLAIADGGTGASNAATARTNLGLALGTDVQAYNANLQAISGLTTAADLLSYWTGSGAAATAALTAQARSFLSQGSTGGQRAILGLGGSATLAVGTTAGTVAAGDDSRITGAAQVANNLSDLPGPAAARNNLGLGSMAVQLAGAVAITGGAISGITDLAVADGGTGASTAANARSNLGLAIGTNVQAWDADLDAVAALTTPATTITGAAQKAANLSDLASAATARTNLGLAIGSNVQAWDADLDALAAIGSAGGWPVRNSVGNWTMRYLVAPAAGITITAPDGLGGNPTVGLANDLAALEGLAATGLAVRTAADTWGQRSVAAGTGIAVTNGDGVAGNPTVAIDTAVVPQLAGTNAFSGANAFSGRATHTGFLNLGTSAAVTIASGVVTVTGSFVSIDTEAAAATDDLDTINGGTVGDLLLIRAAQNTHTVVVKNATGNIKCGADRSLTGVRDAILLIYDVAGFWNMISFADN